MNLRGRFRRAQPLAYGDAIRYPVHAGTLGAWSDDTAEGVQAAVAPVIIDLFRQPRVQGEAAACQRFERIPSHQSSARKPPDFPEAAQATAVRSTTMTSAPRRLRKYATAAPMTPPPQIKTRTAAPP
jgi:hypothetical protein